MASKTSCRCTGTSLGATMPSRTLSPRISTTVTVISLLITMLSFFFLDSTNIAAYPSSEVNPGELAPTRSDQIRKERASEDPLPLQRNQGRDPGRHAVPGLGWRDRDPIINYSIPRQGLSQGSE